MYEIIDNFLPEKEFNNIKSVLMGSEFNWFYNSSVVSEEDEEDIDSFYFFHMFTVDSQINSNYYNLLIPILKKLDVKALIRAKSNLYTKTEQLINHKNHTDYIFEHKGAIFYVNTNNGFTVLEDDTKIESVENRILIFEPHKNHHSTNCTDAKTRLNINFNYF